MKRTILAIIAATMTLPILAQYDGFYRIKNKGKVGRYISIVNDKVDSDSRNPSVSAGTKFMVPVYSLATKQDYISDPGTILYISGGSEDLSLKAQGMSTTTLLGNKYQLKEKNSFMYSYYSGIGDVFLVDNWDVFDETYDHALIVGQSKMIEAGNYAKWEIVPVDNTNDYFAVSPDIKVGDKYYTTLYASFAYQLSEGMKAYYIDAHEYAKTSEPAAELVEITGKVPAATPVILECSSKEVANNKLLPLSSGAPAAISGNQLKGRYFCYYMRSYKGSGGFKEKDNDDPTTKELKNTLPYDATTMRVLGVNSEGKLALVEAKDSQLEVVTGSSTGNTYKYIKANTAYFTIDASEAATTKKGIALMSKEDYATATAISNVVTDQKVTKQGVYTLSGVRVKSDDSTEGLSNGIYIINGKKVVVK